MIAPRALFATIPFALAAACGNSGVTQRSLAVGDTASPSGAAAVNHSSRPGGGRELNCERPNLNTDRGGPLDTLAFPSTWYAVEGIATVSENETQDAKTGRIRTKSVTWKVSEVLRGEIGEDATRVEERGLADLQRFFSSGGQLALIGDVGTGTQRSSLPLVVSSGHAYALNACLTPIGDAIDKYLDRTGAKTDEEKTSELVRLVEEGPGSSAWEALESANRGPRLEATWEETSPDRRTLDPETNPAAPATLLATLQPHDMTISVPDGWKDLPVSFCLKVVGLAWNNCYAASMNSPIHMANLVDLDRRLELWAVDRKTAINTPIALVGNVPRQSAPLRGTLRPIASVDELRERAAQGEALVDWE